MNPDRKEMPWVDPPHPLTEHFAREVLQHRPALLRRARTLCNSEPDAEDLLQDTLIAALKGYRGFAHGTNLRAWLFRIMQNSWIDSFRRRTRRPPEFAAELMTEADLAGRGDRTIACPPAAEDEVLNTYGDSRIRAALESLPEGQRLAVYYTDVEGFTYAETADLLRTPVGTVMSRVHRGRNRLRVSLADLAPRAKAGVTEGDLVA
jgi:RNA polymerase sigma-70 factor (ECF subfamily)